MERAKGAWAACRREGCAWSRKAWTSGCRYHSSIVQVTEGGIIEGTPSGQWQALSSSWQDCLAVSVSFGGWEELSPIVAKLEVSWRLQNLSHSPLELSPFSGLCGREILCGSPAPASAIWSPREQWGSPTGLRSRRMWGNPDGNLRFTRQEPWMKGSAPGSHSPCQFKTRHQK